MTVSPLSSTSKSRGIRQLNYESPLVAVFLRTLAWECYVAKETLRVGQVVTKQLNIARQDLGLPALGAKETSGAGDDYIQQLRKKKLLSPGGTSPAPLDKAWQTEWRLQYLPSHTQVRQLSFQPVVDMQPALSATQTFSHFTVTLRDPALPTIKVWLGPDDTLSKGAALHRGVYVLRSAGGLYLGKTDEFDTRLRQHLVKRSPSWIAFFSPEGDSAFTLDSLGAAEGLLISLWNEICMVENRNRGSDRKPASSYLQQAILFTTSVSAILVWLACANRLPGHDTLPFKKFNHKSLSECYLKVPGR